MDGMMRREGAGLTYPANGYQPHAPRVRSKHSYGDQCFGRVLMYACHCLSRLAMAESCLLAVSSNTAAMCSRDLIESWTFSKLSAINVNRSSLVKIYSRVRLVTGVPILTL